MKFANVSFSEKTFSQGKLSQKTWGHFLLHLEFLDNILN